MMAASLCAERDGHVDCCERCVIMACIGILEIALLLWGSVVVFGAWASWTNNSEEYERDKEAKNFCEYTPMMTAFVILILRWIESPVMLVIRCVNACCCSNSDGFNDIKEGDEIEAYTMEEVEE